MVDFNNSSIVGKSRTDIVNIIIIQRWAEVIDSIRDYYKYKSLGQTHKAIVELQSQVAAIFYQIKQIIEKELEKESTKEYESMAEILLDVQSDDEDRLFKAWNYIDALLYVKGITKIDRKDLYDRTSIFESNRRNTNF